MSITLRPGNARVVMTAPDASGPSGAIVASERSVSTCGQRATCSSACQTAARRALVVSVTVARIGVRSSMRRQSRRETPLSLSPGIDDQRLIGFDFRGYPDAVLQSE